MHTTNQHARAGRKLTYEQSYSIQYAIDVDFSRKTGKGNAVKCNFVKMFGRDAVKSGRMTKKKMEN